jgi:hypothetical protein
MREIRQSGSEGGGALVGSPYPYWSIRPSSGGLAPLDHRLMAATRPGSARLAIGVGHGHPHQAVTR